MRTFKEIRRAIRRPIETAGFRVGAFTIPLLPRAFIVAITHIAGVFTFYFATRERSIGMANLDTVFGNSKTHREKKLILQKSFGSFANTMADIFWFSMNTENRVKKFQQFVPDSGPYFEKKAHVIITAHAGNWELIGLESGMRGLDVASVAAITKNKAIDLHLHTLREKTGMVIIPRKGAMRTLVARFRNHGKAAFVLDQNTAETDGGIWVDFLGIPTPVSSAPAHLAYRTGTDIIFAFSKPVGRGKYEAHTGQVITPPPYDKNQDADKIVAALTQQIMDIVSARIRSHPESWLWSYKHWKTHAPNTSPELYPTYN